MKFVDQETLTTLTTLRQTLHAQPEVAFEEQKTAAHVVSFLKQCGVDEIHTQIGKTGIVAVLRGERPGKTIAFRADMDALPMNEENGEAEVPYRSQIDGCFHGCGHDGHTVMLLGAVKSLAQHRNFAGTLLFIFQCAEENLLGAKAMLDDGLFERFPFDEIYGLHNMPGRSKGVLVVNQASTLSASDIFRITIQGKGGHSAVPESTIDPIVIAARLISDFQTIISRNISPSQAASLSFGSIQGGSAPNIIPDKVVLTGTLRTYHPEVREFVKQRMQVMLDSVMMGYGGKAELVYTSGCPPVINDTELAKHMVSSLQQWLGEESCCLSNSPVGPSEDFAYYLDHSKGVYAFLGMGDVPMCHHPKYNFDDEVIAHGIMWWLGVARARADYQL